MKRHLGFILGFILSFGSLSFAQNLSTTLATQYDICWDQDAPDLATANAYTYKVSVDNAPEVVTQVTCTGTTTPFKCQNVPPLPSVINGSHRFRITANVILIDGSLLSSTVSVDGTYNIVGQPTKPANPRVNKSGT